MAKRTPGEFAGQCLNLCVYLHPQELSAADANKPGYTPVQGWQQARVVRGADGVMPVRIARLKVE